jgi:PAS domain S-box-containing protein
VFLAINLLQHYGIRHLAILDDRDRLCGMLTYESLLQLSPPILDNRRIELEQEVAVRTADLHAKAEQESLIANIALKIRSSLNLDDVLQTTVVELRSLLQCDGVDIWEFAADGLATVLAESFVDSHLSNPGKHIQDCCCLDRISQHRQRIPRVIEDTNRVEMADYHRQTSVDLPMGSKISIPIFQADRIWGIINVIQSDKPRNWQSAEFNLVLQLVTQLEIAIDRATNYQQLQIELKERQRAEESLRLLNQDLESLVRQRSAELQERESQLRELFDNTTDLIQIVSPNGKILYVNRAWQQSLGYSETDLPHLSLFDLVHPDDLKTICVLQQGDTNKPIECGSLSHNVELRLRAKDGRSIVVEGNINCKFQHHRPIAAHCILRDITARKEAETKLTETNHQLAIANAELARASELKDRFLASMSHELRTPLNAILGMSEGLQDEIFGAITDAQRRAINTIARSGNHLLELINDILDLAKIGAGEIELSLSPTEIERLCHSTLALVQPQATKKGINLYLKSPPCLPSLSLDERRIRQVLLNLLSNAVKFTPAGGDVTLSVSIEPTSLVPAEPIPRDRWLRLAVKDTGIGIRDADVERLFQPFVQIDSALNREYAGTGLGLALVKQIVEMHGGRVTLWSEVGVGSEFAIEIPFQSTIESEIGSDTPEISGNLSNCNASILLVEDNAANVSTISNYLTAKGYRLIVAHNAMEAIERVRSHSPDLVLMDIQMPEMDGIEAIERIRQDSHLRSLPIIALTALAMAEDREKCLKVGANDYLSKPVKLKHLVTTIQKNLAPKEAIS